MENQDNALKRAGSGGVVKDDESSQSTVYKFEGPILRGFFSTQRKKNEAETQLPIFANRLGFNTNGLDDPDRNLLFKYIVEHHLNIAWYRKSIWKKVSSRFLFFFLTLALLFLIPVLLFIITNANWSWLRDILGNGGTDTTAAGITAVLTGLLGVHRSLSEWLNKRKLVGLFWKASADLKENLYAFEDTWGNPSKIKRDAQGLADDFKTALREEIKKAKAIVRAEKEQFYQNISPPTIDLHGELKKSQAQAKELMDLFIAPTAKKALAREQTESTIRGLEVRMAELDRRIFEKLKGLTAPGMLPDRQKQHEAVIQNLEEKRIAAEAEYTKMKEKMATL